MPLPPGKRLHPRVLKAGEILRETLKRAKAAQAAGDSQAVDAIYKEYFKQVAEIYGETGGDK